MAVLYVFAAVFLLLIFLFYFNRSTKEMPKTLSELKIEGWYQFYGLLGFFEDFLLKFGCKAELVAMPKKIAVITGGNRGIGLFVVEKLLKSEMTVIMGVRNPETSRKAVETALGKDLTDGKVFCEKCDTGDMESVKEFAKNVQEKVPAIHLLINNAGVMCTPYKETKDGFESQMAINYLGHFLLTHLLMPQLIAGSKENDGKNARVVNVSSCVHKCADIYYDDFHFKKFYYPADAYNKSKLSQVLFTKSLEKLFKTKQHSIQAHSVHPGIVDTDLFENCSSAHFPWVKKIFYKSPQKGSDTIVYAATAPKIEGHGGSYLSNCRERKYHKAADDEDECDKFFDFTCRLVKINSFGVE